MFSFQVERPRNRVASFGAGLETCDGLTELLVAISFPPPFSCWVPRGPNLPPRVSTTGWHFYCLPNRLCNSVLCPDSDNTENRETGESSRSRPVNRLQATCQPLRRVMREGSKGYALGSGETKAYSAGKAVAFTSETKFSMSRRERYQRYLNSSHWNQLRKQAFKRDGFKCTQCGTGKNLRGHHLRYRKDLMLCTVDDILTLCGTCHEQLHRDKSRLRRFNRTVRKSNQKLIDLILDYSAV